MNTSDTRRQLTEYLLEAGAFLGITDKGLQRTANEDRYIIKALPDNAVLLAVADGLGDGGAGKYAAEMIVQTLAGMPRLPPVQAQPALRRMVGDLDRTIFKAAADNPALEGMGSTLICALLQGRRLTWVHAGDSRLYLLRGGILAPVTKDQTLARFLLAEGELTPEQSAGHYAHQVMDQYVGCGHCVPESGELALAPGDLLMLCSDGVHKQIDDHRLSDLLNAPGDLKTRSETILEAVLETGGADNVTLVMARPFPPDLNLNEL